MSTDEVDDRAARLRARSQHVRENASRQAHAREWAHQQVAAVEGTAASGDGLVRATVDGNGLLIRLELSPEVRRARSNDVAHVITAVVQRAVGNARNQIRDIYTWLHNEGAIGELPSMPAAPATENMSVPLVAPEDRPSSSEAGPNRFDEPPEGRAGTEKSRHGESPPSTWLDPGLRSPWARVRRDERG